VAATLWVVTALTVVTAPRLVIALVVVVGELALLELFELPVPLSEMVTESRALASEKSACTVWATVPLAAVEVR
jgi:hypothetical protein